MPHSAPDFGVGRVEWLRIEGLGPGFYRLRKTSTEGAEATGMFTVVDNDVDLVHIGSAGSRGVSVEPVVLTPSVNMVNITHEHQGAVGVRVLQRWDGASWVDTGEHLDVVRHPQGGPDHPNFAIPSLAPGAYRIHDTFTDGAIATGVFWVEEPYDPTRTGEGTIVLDDGRLVVESFPEDFRPRTMPQSSTTPMGRERSTWDFGSRERQAAVSISVERGAGATDALAAYSVVDGVTRQGAAVYRADDPGVPLPRPIGWSPAPDVVIWLGTNSAEIDLVTLSEGIRYQDPPTR